MHHLVNGDFSDNSVAILGPELLHLLLFLGNELPQDLLQPRVMVTMVILPYLSEQQQGIIGMNCFAKQTHNRSSNWKQLVTQCLQLAAMLFSISLNYTCAQSYGRNLTAVMTGSHFRWYLAATVPT